MLVNPASRVQTKKAIQNVNPARVRVGFGSPFTTKMRERNWKNSSKRKALNFPLAFLQTVEEIHDRGGANERDLEMSQTVCRYKSEGR